MAASVGRTPAAVQSDKTAYHPRMPHCTSPTDAAATFADLDTQGLNLQAVFNLAELPADILAALPEHAAATYPQLILIGHRGGTMWQHVSQTGMAGPDPIDQFTRTQVTAWLEREHPTRRYCFVYPGPTVLGLQRLGTLAGWHHPSPFMVGIDPEWGSWFAYRAVVLADTQLPPTPRRVGASPCDTCASRVCVSACPAGALTNGFDLKSCLAYRGSPGSACQDRCVARNTCPVGADHRYSDAQIRYHYGRSMKVIQKARPA